MFLQALAHRHAGRGHAVESQAREVKFSFDPQTRTSSVSRLTSNSLPDILPLVLRLRLPDRLT